MLALNRLRRLESAEREPEPVHVLPTPEEMEVALGLERSERRRILPGLASLGFDPGPADGLFGRDTRGAVRRLQRTRGREATGFLDAELSKELLSA